MNSNRFSIKFYPRIDRQNKEGLHPIYARITSDKKTEISTTMYIGLKDWNNQDQRAKPKCKDASTINTYLNSFHSIVLEAYSTLFVTKTVITAEVLKERFLFPQSYPQGTLWINHQECSYNASSISTMIETFF